MEIEIPEVKPLPTYLSESYCTSCKKTTHIQWKKKKDIDMPYCVHCNTANWQAMVHLNRKTGAYHRT